MKLPTVLSVLAAVASTTVAVADKPINTHSPFHGLPLTFALTPNATELLQAHGLWAPDAAAFAAGEPNTAILGDINLTAEAHKFVASGLKANDIVVIGIDNNGGAVVMNADNGEEAQKHCSQCDTCQWACMSLILFLPGYGA